MGFTGSSLTINTIAMEEVPCYLCGDEVMVGDDYRIHVTIAHGVEYDEDRILSLAARGEEKSNTTGDNVTLAENSDDHDDGRTDKYEVIGQLENIHLNNKVDAKDKQNTAKSFFDLFDDKLKQIKDLAEGKIEPISVEDSKVEDIDDNQIWKMFENVKNKVMNMEIQETISSTKSPGHNYDPLKINSDPQEKEMRRWYQGTFYECNECETLSFGESKFKSHLAASHKVERKSITNLKDFSSYFQEKLYSCQVCQRKVKHEFKNIYQHLRTQHSLTVNEYENKFPNIVEEEKQLIQVKKSQPIRSQVEQIQPVRSQNVGSRIENLQPIRSQVLHSKNSKPSKNQSGLLRQVKSQVEKLPSVKKVTDFPPTGKTLDEMMPPPSTNNAAPKNPGSAAELPEVKQEAMPFPTPKLQSLYYCPISDCSFYTSKEGMKNSKAALHMKNDHKIQAKDMKPGMYKFTKIKV